MSEDVSSHEKNQLRQEQSELRRDEQRVAVEVLQKRLSRKKYVKWGVGGVVVVLLLSFFFVPGSSEQFGIGDHPVTGNVGSPVEFVVFGDFQCPFTKKFFLGAFQEVQQEFGDRIKIGFRPMPTNRHANDKLSAEAAYCAGDQGGFWEFAKLVFERQGRADRLSLLNFAGELGLDVKVFGSCLQSGKYVGKVKDDYRAGRKFGVVVTPTVYVNENPIAGDVPFVEYKKLIEWTLEKK